MGRSGYTEIITSFKLSQPYFCLCERFLCFCLKHSCGYVYRCAQRVERAKERSSRLVKMFWTLPLYSAIYSRRNQRCTVKLGWARRKYFLNLSSVWSLLYFLLFSLSFLNFLPKLGPLGGQLANTTFVNCGNLKNIKAPMLPDLKI